MEFYDSSTLWKTLSRRWTINIALPISLHCSSNDLAQKITHTVTAIKAGPSNIFVMYSSILHEFTTGVKCLILAIIYVNHSMKMWCSISWCRRPQDPDKVPSFPIGLWLLSDTYYARSPRLRWQKMISPSNWSFKKNHCIWTTIRASVVSFNRQNYFWGLYWQKITFLSNFEQKILANCGSGLPAEWPFHSQNAFEASDSPLPGGLWVKRLITHALCSLAYSDIASCKLFLIFTMKCLFWGYYLPTKHHIVYWLIIPSMSKKLTLKKLGWHFMAKFLDASNIYQFRN